MQRTGVDHAAWTKWLEFTPNGRVKKWTDENKDYVTKSKLTIAANTLRKYIDWSRVAAKQTNKQTNKQTQRYRNWKTFSQKNKKTYLQIDVQADFQKDTCTETGKQKIKNEALCSVAMKISK